ncbi:MAG: ribosome maturation factor RimP [Corynebacterium sp.]|nr:ribosome maturation factor RimP [Corynebacterium sp.]
MAFPTPAELREYVSPIVAEYNVELDGISISSAGKKSRVLITVDAERDVDLNTVEAISQEISRAFDVAEERKELNFGAGYTLEVSTRGVEAPLELPRHWRKNQGRLVRLAPGEKPVRIGALHEDGNQVITIARVRKQPVVEAVELAQYPQAMVEIEFSTPAPIEVELSQLSFEAAMNWREDHK